MAPIGLKIWENAFQMIPDIALFDVRTKKMDENVRLFFCGKKIAVVFFAKCPFWRSYDILDVTGSCSSKNDPRGPEIHPSTTLGGGVKGQLKVFLPTFGLKATFTKKRKT